MKGSESGSTEPLPPQIAVNGRFFWLLGLGLAAAIAGLLYLLRAQLLPQQLAVVEAHAEIIGRLVQATYPTLEAAQVQPHLAAIQRGEPSLTYLAIVDRAGKALAHSNPARVGMLFNDPVSLEAARDGQASRQFYVRDRDNPSSPVHGERVVDFNWPLTNQAGVHVGALTLGLSMSRLEAENRRNWLNFAGAAAIVLLLYILLACGHVRQVRLNIQAMLRQQQERDAEEHRRLETVLRESEQRYRALIDSVPDLLMVVDSQAIIKYTNNRGTLMLGYPFEYFHGKNPLEWVHPEDRSLAEEELALILQGKNTPVPKEMRVRRADGTWIWVEILGTNHLEDPWLRGILVHVCDITHRKLAAEQNMALESQLRQAQKLEAVGTLAGGIAHDFNNLLAVIMSSAEMARRDRLGGGETKEMLDSILTASTRAKELVREILAFSRQAGVERSPLHLEAVVQEALKLLRATLPATLEISVAMPSRLPPICGNSAQIQQVLINLCTNAAHAMGGKSGRLEIQFDVQDLDEEFVRSKPELKPGRHLRLSVSDTGHGMDADTLKRIFEPFFTTKQPGQGTGLGLSVVHGIVRDHQGAVSVYSQPGRGTTFRLYFPAIAAAEPPPKAQPPSPAGGQGQRILVVEDEALVAALMERMLKRLHYVPTIINNPALALETFRKDPAHFDAVITDMTMPKMTGLQLAAAIRALRPGIPIALCSGFTGDFSPETMREAGISEVLSKPATFDEISGMLTRLVPAANSTTTATS